MAQMLRPPFALRQRETHFLCLFPEEVDPALLKTYAKLLCPKELADASRARTPAVEVERVLAPALLRTTLARYADGRVEPSSLRFAKNEFGKPRVVWPKTDVNGKLWTPPPLCFNLSHTNSLIACAVTLDSAVGIDVEEMNRKPTSNVMKLARRWFSAAEVEWLQQFTDSEEQRQQFMRLWVLKEGYVKAIGKGMYAMPFKNFSFTMSESPVVPELMRKSLGLQPHRQARCIALRVAAGERPSSAWKIVLFQPSTAHVASICVEDHNQSATDCEGDKSHHRIRALKTVPFLGDQHLPEGTTGLGISDGYLP